jgi:hypothetical protein
MVAEKAWAKLLGSYANSESGWNAWVLRYLTDDPVQVIRFDTFNNNPNTVAGKKMWQRLLHWSEREYLIFSSTNDKSFVKFHTYTVLSAKEAYINGKKVRLLLMRNPWGKVKWKGAWSEGSKQYKALE